MQMRNKSIVRRRTPADDEGVPADSIWPSELVWVHDHDIVYEDGTFHSGGTYPFATWDEAMADAQSFNDYVRKRNEADRDI